VKSAGAWVGVSILQRLWYDSIRENADLKKRIFPGDLREPGV
jgi:hypothetical protein